jgi:signal transduction histidine kinase
MRMGMILALLANCLLNIILLPANVTRWLGIGAAGIAANLVILYFSRQGQRRLAGFLLLASIWLIATLAAATAGGIQAPAARSYFVIVLFAGLLFGGRAGVYTGLLCIASGGALVILEAKGWLPANSVQHTPLSLWIINTCFIFIVVLFVHVATKSTWEALQRARAELKERTRAEDSLRESEAERVKSLQRERHAREEYPRRLIASQEAERTRIAAELHDGLGQNLLLVRNRSQLALSSAMAPELRELFENINSLASQALAEVRQISQDLHPYQIDHLGLTRAIEAMIETASQSSGVIFERKLDSADDIFSGVAATNLYRIVQESLSNVLKHSGAARVHVRLERDVREVLLCVEDDGCGFQPETVNGAGLGLRNITERVHILGGTLRVASRPGEGTSVCVAIPIPELA